MGCSHSHVSNDNAPKEPSAKANLSSPQTTKISNIIDPKPPENPQTNQNFPREQVDDQKQINFSSGLVFMDHSKPSEDINIQNIFNLIKRNDFLAFTQLVNQFYNSDPSKFYQVHYLKGMWESNPLMVAMQYKQLEFIDFLMKQYPPKDYSVWNELNEKGASIILFAVMEGLLEEVKYLVSKNVTVDILPSKDMIYNPLRDFSQYSTPLSVAIVNNRISIIKFILDQNLCDINHVFSFSILKSKRKKSTTIQSQPNSTCLTPLLLAASYGQYLIIQELIRRNCDYTVKDSDQMNLWHHLVYYKPSNSNSNSSVASDPLDSDQILNEPFSKLTNYQIMKLLLNIPIDLDNDIINLTYNNTLLSNEVLRSEDCNGDSLLHLACETKQLELVRLLLLLGSDPNQINSINHNAPLHIAINKRSTDIIKLLVQFKADITLDVQDSNIPTPFEAAKKKFPPTSEINIFLELTLKSIEITKPQPLEQDDLNKIPLEYHENKEEIESTDNKIQISIPTPTKGDVVMPFIEASSPNTSPGQHEVLQMNQTMIYFDHSTPTSGEYDLNTSSFSENSSPSPLVLRGTMRATFGSPNPLDKSHIQVHDFDSTSYLATINETMFISPSNDDEKHTNEESVKDPIDNNYDDLLINMLTTGSQGKLDDYINRTAEEYTSNNEEEGDENDEDGFNSEGAKKYPPMKFISSKREDHMPEDDILQNFSSSRAEKKQFIQWSDKINHPTEASINSNHESRGYVNPNNIIFDTVPRMEEELADAEDYIDEEVLRSIDHLYNKKKDQFGKHLVGYHDSTKSEVSPKNPKLTDIHNILPTDSDLEENDEEKGESNKSDNEIVTEVIKKANSPTKKKPKSKKRKDSTSNASPYTKPNPIVPNQRNSIISKVEEKVDSSIVTKHTPKPPTNPTQPKPTFRRSHVIVTSQSNTDPAKPSSTSASNPSSAPSTQKPHPPQQNSHSSKNPSKPTEAITNHTEDKGIKQRRPTRVKSIVHPSAPLSAPQDFVF